jgi:hypothetical protein
MSPLRGGRQSQLTLLVTSSINKERVDSPDSQNFPVEEERYLFFDFN